MSSRIFLAFCSFCILLQGCGAFFRISDRRQAFVLKASPEEWVRETYYLGIRTAVVLQSRSYPSVRAEFFATLGPRQAEDPEAVFRRDLKKMRRKRKGRPRKLWAIVSSRKFHFQDHLAHVAILSYQNLRHWRLTVSKPGHVYRIFTRTRKGQFEWAKSAIIRLLEGFSIKNWRVRPPSEIEVKVYPLAPYLTVFPKRSGLFCEFLLKAAPDEGFAVTKAEIRFLNEKGKMLVSYKYPLGRYRRMALAFDRRMNRSLSPDQIPVGGMGLFFFQALLPPQLNHYGRLEGRFQIQRDNGQRQVLTAQITPVHFHQKNRYTLPVKGGYYIHAGPSWRSHHRKSANIQVGRVVVTQRYAFDMLMLGPGNKIFKGKGKKNEDYFGYNEPVYAPSPGKIVMVIDGIPDNKPGRVNTWAIGGNVVVIKHRGGEYSYMAHFRRGSIAVKNGQYVQRGVFLGRIGNSGHSTAPHLHYHVADGPSLLSDRGLPVRFSNFEMRKVKSGSWIVVNQAVFPSGVAVRARKSPVTSSVSSLR